MNVLVLNCGSSTIKFQLIATDLEQIAQNADQRLAGGSVERVGGEAIITLQVPGREPQRSTATLRDTRAAIDMIVRWAGSENSGIAEVKSVADINAVGHRVVHGGEAFTHSVLIDDEVLRGIDRCIDLAPLQAIPASLQFGYVLPQVQARLLVPSQLREIGHRLPLALADRSIVRIGAEVRR